MFSALVCGLAFSAYWQASNISQRMLGWWYSELHGERNAAILPGSGLTGCNKRCNCVSALGTCAHECAAADRTGCWGRTSRKAGRKWRWPREGDSAGGARI